MGSSNSPYAATSGHSVPTVRQAGVDTWSPCWYVQEASAAESAMNALATIPAPQSRLLPEKIEGHTVGWFPGSRLVFAEGHPGGDRLGSPDDLPNVLCSLERSIKDFGIPLPGRRTRSIWRGDQTADRLPGFAGVRRCDATVDLQTASSADGLAILAGVAAVARELASGQAEVRYAASRRAIETVTFRGHSGKRILGRFYDKGIEAGTAPRGRLIRPEDQRRYQRQNRRDVEELSSAYVRGKFRERFAPLWRATKGVTVAGPVIFATKLLDLQEEGHLTHRQAEDLAGFALLETAGAYRGPSRTRRRRRAALRDHGLVLAADELADEVEVDLHAALEEALETDAWMRRS